MTEAATGNQETTMTSQTIEAVMSSKAEQHLIVVPASASVAEAVDLMVRRDIGAVIVMSEDNLTAGIFTERDVLTRVVHAGADPATTPISLVMTREVRFVSPGTTLEAALALMHVNHHRHLLVIDGARVLGLLSLRDLAYHLIRHGAGRFEAAVRAAGPAAVD